MSTARQQRITSTDEHKTKNRKRKSSTTRQSENIIILTPGITGEGQQKNTCDHTCCSCSSSLTAVLTSCRLRLGNAMSLVQGRSEVRSPSTIFTIFSSRGSCFSTLPRVRFTACVRTHTHTHTHTHTCLLYTSPSPRDD